MTGPRIPKGEPRPDFPMPGAPPRQEEKPAQPAPPQPPQPAEQTPAPQPAAEFTWRDRITVWRCQAILFLRWLLRPLYRIPSDDLREQTRERDMLLLFQNQKQLLLSLNKLIEVNNGLQQRLSYYEHNIPRMRELKRELIGLKPSPNGHHVIELLKP